MVARGDVWWVDFGEPIGSVPGYRRPAIVVSSDRFNRSRIGTVVVAAVTSNLQLGAAPGNIALKRRVAGLPKASVINVSQILTIDRQILVDPIGVLPATTLLNLNAGLRLVLGL